MISVMCFVSPLVATIILGVASVVVLGTSVFALYKGTLGRRRNKIYKTKRNNALDLEDYTKNIIDEKNAENEETDSLTPETPAKKVELKEVEKSEAPKVEVEEVKPVKEVKTVKKVDATNKNLKRYTEQTLLNRMKEQKTKQYKKGIDETSFSNK